MVNAGEEIDMGMVTNSALAALNDAIYWILLFSSILTLVVVIVIFVIRKKSILIETQINRFSLQYSFPVILIALSMQMLLTALIAILPIPNNLLESFAGNVSTITNKINLITIFSVGLLVPFAEEVIFRGLILSRLKRGMPVYIAVIIQAVIFGVIHTGLVWMIQAFIMGVILALLAIRFNSILPSILAHVAINISALLQNVLVTQEWSEAVVYLIFAISIVVFIAMLFVVMKFGGGKKETEQVQAGV